VRWSLLLFILAIPFEAVDLGLGGFLSPARVAGLPFFAACLLAPRLSFRMPSAAAWWFFAYLGVVAVEGLYTPPGLRSLAVSVFATLVQLVIFFWIATNLFRDRALTVRAMRSYAVAAVALSVGVIAGLPGFSESFKTRESAASLRVTALDYNANNLAAMAALGAVVLLGAFLNTNLKLRSRLFFGVAAVPLAVLIIRTASRSGALAFLAGLAVFLLPAGGSRRRLTAVVLAGLVLLGVVFLVVTNPLLEARLNATYQHGDTAGRNHIYSKSLSMIAERPIVGWGPGSGLYELGRRLNYAGGAKDTHNLLLYLLVEVGLVGTVPFLIGLALVVRTAWRGRSGPLGLVPLALVAVVLTANLSHTFLARKPVWLVLAVAMASAPARRAQRPLARKPFDAARVYGREPLVRGAGIP
jgi:O-antigen ligase